MIKCEYIDKPKDTDTAIAFLQETLMPMIFTYWQERGQNVYDKNFDFNILAFINMWMVGSIELIVAYEDDKPVGFLLGVRFTAMLFRENVVQLEAWYGEREEIERELFAYLERIAKFQDVGEIWLTNDTGSPGYCSWPVSHNFKMVQYHRP